MVDYPTNQSVWGRARQDTISAFHTISFWVVEMISAPIVAVGMYFAIPSFVSSFVKTILPIAAFSIWMLAMLGGVFLLSLLVAPYRQRNEARALLQTKPKPKPLSNRDALLKALMDVQNSAMELVNSQETLDNVNGMGKPLAQEAWGKMYQSYKHSLQDLDKELVVAGEAYELCILRFKGFVREQVWLKIVKPTQIGGDEPIALGKYEFPARLGEETKRAIRTINQISGQVLDKEGSQTE